jgi:distribution and morphology protein 31
LHHLRQRGWSEVLSLPLASSMSLRPHFLARPLREDIGTSLSQAAHQRTRHAASERYSAIRSFFKQQHRRAPSLANAPSPAYLGHRASYGESFLARSTFYVSGMSARALHTTNVLLKQGQPSQLPPPPTPSRATGHDKLIGESHRDAKHESEEIEDGSRVPNHLENYPAFLRRLAMSVPNIPRPTRDDLLRVADGFWQRARIRFRWFTIKSFRKFNADDISAFVTWFLMSQTIWILVGT